LIGKKALRILEETRLNDPFLFVNLSKQKEIKNLGRFKTPINSITIFINTRYMSGHHTRYFMHYFLMMVVHCTESLLEEQLRK
jgi:hypothetical protein